MTAPVNDETRLQQAHRDMWSAMVDRDIGALGGLLADGYTLTHMTGYRQEAAEWLAQVDSGRMRYHSTKERSVVVEIHGETAVLVGQNTVDATIWGSRGTWPLQLTTSYRRDGHAGWIALSTVATTF